MDASVDTSLGNIRENIRKGANQKHISTSMVDPLKQMKKSGKTKYLFYYSFNTTSRSECPCLQTNASTEVFGRISESKRNTPGPIVVQCQVKQSVNCDEIWMVKISHSLPIFLYHIHSPSILIQLIPI